MSKYLPNCPHLSKYDGCGTAGILELMRESGHSAGSEATITITEETTSDSPVYIDRAGLYSLGYKKGYKDAVYDSRRRKYRIEIYNAEAIMYPEEKEKLWSKVRNKNT